MRKTLHIFLALLLLTAGANAQAPAGINYQLVVRDGSGNVLSSRAVSIQFALRQGSAAGTIVFAENHAATTGSLGLVNLVLGNGTATTGTLAAVNWAAGPYYLETLIDQNGGSSYTSMGTQQLVSVPYALHAGNGLSNGTANNQMMYWNGISWVSLAAPTVQSQVLTHCDGMLVWAAGGVCPGTITSLSCDAAINNGALSGGTAASQVSTIIPYSGGNGGPFIAQTLSSTGVSGLTATLAAGNFANGAGNLIFTISGTPSGGGIASFLLNIGGRSCTITRIVSGFPAGTANCSAATSIVDVTNPSTGRIWMDRNLGASRAATGTTDASAYGDLYQWGRRADGHQCRSSATISTSSSIDQPAHGSFILPPPSSPYDWRNPQNESLWQGAGGTNNPCPGGYRIPTEAELNAERLSWSSQNSAGAYASPLKMIMAGYRNSNFGSVTSSGIDGVYWTSNVISGSGYSRYMYFGSSSVVFDNNPRAFGHAVRCIKHVTEGSIGSLGCASPTNIGTLTSGTAASGVSSSIAYTGGNGGPHNGQSASSTGVTGLTATLTAGTFASGSGSLTYTITGTPSGSGTASFALNIGGQTCTLSRTVGSVSPSYPSSTVHCSGTPTAVVEVTNPGTGRIWMDRNLGTSRAATSSTDANAYGDLYQWGRIADGHQCRNSTNTSTLSSTDQPSYGNFIIATPFPYDWRSPQNDNLWQGLNGTNNPCPTGYRIPTDAEWNAERLSWSSNNTAGAMASPLKLALAGYRSGINGSLNYVGAFGGYWSSAVSGTYARYLYFNGGDAGMSSDYRANGFSVRCIKD